MRTRFALITLLGALPLALLAARAGDELRLPRGAKRATAKISADSIRSVVAELGSDAYEGRGPGSAGDAKARAWLEARMQALGFAPGAADGTYQQRFEMIAVQPDLPAEWRFLGANGAVATLKPREDFVAIGEKQRELARVADSEVVFVGYGIVASEFDWNDYKSDVRGKTVLILNNDPDWDDALFAGNRRLYYGRWDYKFAEAARHGAAAAVAVHTTPSAGYPWQVVRTSWGKEEYQLPLGDEPTNEVRGWVTEAKAREIAALGGHDFAQLTERAKSREFAPVALGATTSLEVRAALRRIETANVLALLPGRDAKLRDQIVVYTAHHDHLGIGEPDASGDGIYNGALDNAAGVAVVANVAEAFAALPRPPRRSVLFAFVAAEEQGLLGSKFYAANPTAPPGRLAANVNFDGANILARSSAVEVIGRGKSSLEELLALAAARQSRAIVDERFPDRGFYYRSDQLNFARIGVPALYFRAAGEGIGKPAGWLSEQRVQYEAERYHQPSDELDDSWDFAGAVEDAQLGFWVGAAAAEADAMPTWRAGDEFETTRKAALEALTAE
ncbi:MAG: M28 family peptidase [Deltaproteobacteria bacterium]|nr:M28 family peptidase [Deltaproteobacteria bacterium]